MDRFASLEACVKVADAGGFSAAARVLGVSTAVVSERVKQLEILLRRPLFHRTTRYVAPTQFCLSVLPEFRKVVRQVGDLETLATAPNSELTGRIRVASVIDFGISHIAPAIAEFANIHASLKIELDVNNHVVNPIEAGYDISIHFREVINQDLTSTILFKVENGYFAAPAYLVAKQAPITLGDLSHHACIGYNHQDNVNRWNARRWRAFDGDRELIVEVPLTLTSNSGHILRHYALKGLGVAVLPIERVADDVAAGRLVRVLPNLKPESLALSAVHLARHEGAHTIQTFVGHLKSVFQSN
jgi:DNA-binding transcriptional LysR family regulator